MRLRRRAPTTTGTDEQHECNDVEKRTKDEDASLPPTLVVPAEKDVVPAVVPPIMPTEWSNQETLVPQPRMFTLRIDEPEDNERSASRDRKRSREDCGGGTPAVPVGTSACSPTPCASSSSISNVSGTPVGRVHSQMGCRIRDPAEVLETIKFYFAKPSGGALTDKFRRVSKVGEGTYGTVHIAEAIAPSAGVLPNSSHRKKVAVKKLKVFNEGFNRTSIREIYILRNIQRSCRRADDRRRFVLIDEVLPEGDGTPDVNLIFDFIDYDVQGLLSLPRSVFVLSEEEKLYIVRQVLHAVVLLHQASIIHRDIKPDNILVRKDGSVALADFGLAVSINTDRNKTPRMVCMSYRCPEMLLGSVKYNEKVDIWSVGVLLTHLLLKEPLFYAGGSHNREQQTKQQAMETEVMQLESISKVLGPVKLLPSQADCPDYERVSQHPKAYYLNGEGRMHAFYELVTEKARKKGCIEPSWQCIELLRRVFQLNPADRPTAAEMLRMPGLFMAEERERSIAAGLARRLASLPPSHQLTVKDQRAAAAGVARPH
jgi:serine/threonine protein kinase